MTGQVDSDRPTPLGSQRLRPARLDPVDLGTTGESMDEQPGRSPGKLWTASLSCDVIGSPIPLLPTARSWRGSR